MLVSEVIECGDCANTAHVRVLNAGNAEATGLLGIDYEGGLRLDEPPFAKPSFAITLAPGESRLVHATIGGGNQSIRLVFESDCDPTNNLAQFFTAFIDCF